MQPVLPLDERNLYGMYAVWHVPFWQTNWFYYAMIAAASSVALIVLFFIVRWWRSRFAAITPWDHALSVCNSLAANSYTTRESCKKGYLTITNLLKSYWQQRYNVETIGKTDEEFIAYLQHKNASHAILKDIETIVQGGFLVKFANQDALQEQMYAHIALCKAIITRTIPAKSDRN